MNKRGISPVIATLLLIIIAVAAAVLTYLWITGYMGTLQAQSSTRQTQERIKIEAVQVSGTTITVYVRNVGDVNCVVDAVYIINATSGSIIGSNTGVGLSLAPGNVNTVAVTLGSGLTDGKTYIVKVVTQTGVEVTYEFLYRA